MRIGLYACCAPLLLGCVEADPDRVRLSASITEPDLTLEESALVSVLSGSLLLELELGDLASDPTTLAEVPRFDLVDDEDNSLVRTLDVMASGSAFPVSIDVGTSVNVPFELTDDNTLVSAEVEALCSGPVAIVAVVRDSLSDGQANAIRSEPFRPDGCP